MKNRCGTEIKALSRKKLILFLTKLQITKYVTCKEKL